MNLKLEQTIFEKLHTLDDKHLAEVLDFVEFLQARQTLRPLTGLFETSESSEQNNDPARDALDELRRERADSIEQTTVFTEKS